MHNTCFVPVCIHVVVRDHDVGGGEALETNNGNNGRSIQGGTAQHLGQKVDVPVVKVDHKYLVGSLIVGQGIGFLGSVIGGNEARKKAGGTRQPVAPSVAA